MHPNWFVGLPVAAGAWYEALPPPPAEVRLFAATDLHATVAFLGAVEESAARRAFALAVTWPTGPLDVRLAGLRALGNRRKPSALSVMLGEGAEAVAEGIAALRDDMLATAGARPDSRPPLPHVTLARIGRRADARERKAALAWAEAIDLGAPAVRLDRIALYTWSADRRARLFDLVAERPLEGA
ncbi:MAG: 2'-5' RNA ligase family protein [Actinomycetota bacterium]|nr:2'-5' RNA ligase family protein [Actinomycetota bacterium]